MSGKYRWLKILGNLLLIIICLIIVNGFFRENHRLLEERNRWQEKAKELKESVQELEKKNEALAAERPAGVIIKDFQAEAVAFLPNETPQLEYKLTATLENTIAQRVQRISGLLLFVWRAPGGNMLRTTTRGIEFSALNPGEVKTFAFTGRVAAQSRDTLLVILSLEQQPGIAKQEIFLSALATP